MDRHKFAYIANKQQIRKKSKSRSRTRSVRLESEDEGLLPIPNRIDARHDSEDFLANGKSVSRTETPKLTTANSCSESQSRDKNTSCNFRMKYYRSLGVIGRSYRPPSPSLSEPRVPIGHQVAREDFDWKCESPALQSILFERPISPIKGGHTGIFELEE